MSQIQWEERGQEEAEKVGLPYVKFDTIGTEFVGKYLSQEEETSTFNGESRKSTVYTFMNKQGSFKVNPPADLRKRLATLKIGEIAKIIYVSDKDIGKPSPMKVFKLMVAKTGPTATPAPVVNPGLDF